MELKIEKISKSYDGLTVLRNFSIQFIPGKINCVLGPSGCGKTTLLNIMAGLLQPEEGDISDFTGKDISYVFQEDRLLPWKTVRDNIRFVLQSRYSGNDLEEILDKNIRLIDLANFSRYYPHQLSGGMKRRVSIVRAFSYPSEIVLLDEPFKGIDISLKQNLMESIISIWNQDKRTLIYVTHDIDESIYLGHRIFIFTGRPARVIRHFDLPGNYGSEGSSGREVFELKEEIRRLLMDQDSGLLGNLENQ